jgi:hypothetical protein
MGLAFVLAFWFFSLIINEGDWKLTLKCQLLIHIYFSGQPLRKILFPPSTGKALFLSVWLFVNFNKNFVSYCDCVCVYMCMCLSVFRLGC